MFTHGLTSAQVEAIFLSGTAGLCPPIPTTLVVVPSPLTARFGDPTYPIDVFLRDAQGNGVPGKSIYLQSQVSSWPHSTSSTTRTTDANGRVHWDPTLRNAVIGTYTGYVYMSFDGDTDYVRSIVGATVIVGKGTPVITWNTPAPLTYGTFLPSSALNATANVPGTFSYSPGAGTGFSGRNPHADDDVHAVRAGQLHDRHEDGDARGAQSHADRDGHGRHVHVRRPATRCDRHGKVGVGLDVDPGVGHL